MRQRRGLRPASAFASLALATGTLGVTAAHAWAAVTPAVSIGSVTALEAFDNTPSEWGENVVLTANINMAGQPFSPIGNLSTPFTGTFNGAGYTISGLDVTGAIDQAHLGVFGVVTGTVDNLTVSGVTLQPSSNQTVVGGLVGLLHDGTVMDSQAQATISFTSGVGGTYAGGLVGLSESGTIVGSRATGTITSTNSGSFGGLVGEMLQGSVSGDTAAVTVTMSSLGATSIGGLVGSLEGPAVVTGSRAIGSVTGGSGQAGGLIGFVELGTSGSTVVQSSEASGSVSVGRFSEAGGLIGYLASFSDAASVGTITGDYASGNVSTTGAHSTVGGLIGGVQLAAGSVAIDHSDAIGAVTASGSSPTMGGLVGSLQGFYTGSTPSPLMVFGSFAAGPVSATSMASTSPSSQARVGGLVGWADLATIAQSFAEGTVTGPHGPANVGGLVGWDDQVSITNTFALGSVTGFVSPSTSSPEGVARWGIGGLLGQVSGSGTVADSYAVGTVTNNGTAVSSSTIGVGGFAGVVSGTGTVFQANFYDVSRPPQVTSAMPGVGLMVGTATSGSSVVTTSPAVTGITGGTTAALQTEATYTQQGWDFGNGGVWAIDPPENPVNSGYPYLLTIEPDGMLPTGQVPEVPWAGALPLTAVALAGLWLSRRRAGAVGVPVPHPSG